MNSSAALGRASETFAALPRLAGPEALVRLHAIAEALPSCGSPERLTAIAGALPRRVAELAPEVGLALAELALALADHCPRLPDDLDSLGPRLRVAWLRVVLTIDEGHAPLEGIDETLVLRALIGWPLDDVKDPSALLEALARAEDPRLRRVVLDRLQTALHHLAITAERACELLLRLAEDPEPSIRRAAFTGLVQTRLPPTAPLLIAARDRLVQARLDDEDETIAATCIALTASAGARDPLVELAFARADRTGPRRATAIVSLGPLACDEDLEPLLALASVDPLGFGPCTLAFVLAAHRRGVFIREAQIPALLACFDSHVGWTGELLVRVTHIVRAALIGALAELPADDRRWIRRASILAASIDATAHELLASKLRATSDERIAAALVDAAGRSPDFDDEPALLGWLDRIPERVVAVLKVKGGDAAASRLRALVEDPCCPASLRSHALAALWALSRDRGPLLRELAQRLGPHAAGLLDRQGKPTRASLAAELILESNWPAIPEHAIDPLVALGLLCDSAEPRWLPEIRRRFRALFEGYVGQALAGDLAIKRLRMPELEQLVYRYARNLIADGRCVRRWIEDSPDTGRELVLALAIDWLSEQPAPALCVALLETLARHQPSGASLRRIEAFWRHRDSEVQRAAIAALVAAGEHARGLELSIARLADADDPRIASQALDAVASLAARWAEPRVIAALAQPAMAVKKAAAAALEVVGSERCVPTLVEWIGRHDNASFRASLLAALRASAGAGATAILVDAYEAAEDRRTKTLVREALSGLLTLRGCLRLARASEGPRVELVEAAIRAELRLADASPEQLAAALHRAKLRTLPIVEHDPTRSLRLDGFSSAAALAVLELRDEAREREILDVVRASLVEWLRWLSGDDRPKPDAYSAALALTIEATTPAQAEHFDALLTLLEAGAESGAESHPGIVARFLERCLSDVNRPVAERARGLAILRSLPSSAELGGLRRWALLGQLGALRGRDDLDTCLAACRIGPQLAIESERLLTLAFAIPSKRDDELQRLGKAALAELERLREGAKTWYRASSADADAWVATTLAARPFDLPALGFGVRPESERPKPTREPSSRADLDSLLAIVGGEGGDPTARDRAAEQILAWPDARSIADAWGQVLERYLGGELQLGRDALAKLAPTLERWPEPGSPALRGRASALFEWLDLDQRRRFLPGWIGAWTRGEPDARERLAAVEQELLIPLARARVAAGDPTLLRLLRPDGSLALRELIAFVGDRAPDELAHLLPQTSLSKPAPTLDDPLVGKSLEQLVALLRAREVEIGLAVRAIHALAKLEDRGADAIEPFTLDRRPQVRSAALRALRKLVPKARSLQAIVGVLEIEDRRDVFASLLASIGHARFRPGLTRILGALIDPDPKLRDAAQNALQAWGSEVIPDLVRASRKARPDRRSRFEQVIAAIEIHAQAEPDRSGGV